jgi:hypothetical protein
MYTHTIYDRIFGDFPAKITVYTPYIYGSGQPYSNPEELGALSNSRAKPCLFLASELHLPSGEGASVPLERWGVCPAGT